MAQADAAVRALRGRRDLALRECRRAARDPLVRPGRRREARRSRVSSVFFNFLPIVLSAFFGGVIVDRLGFRTTSVRRGSRERRRRRGDTAPRSRRSGSSSGSSWRWCSSERCSTRPGRRRARRCSPTWSSSPGSRMERASGIRSSDPAGLDTSSARRSAACSSQRSERRRPSGSTPQASWSRPRSSVLFVPRPHAGEATGEAPRTILRRARRRHALHLESAARCAHSSLTVLVTNLLEAPLPIVLAVFAREEYGSAAALGLMLRRRSEPALSLARSATARSATGSRGDGRS